MGAIASRITGASIVHSIICWCVDQKHQSSASLAFVRGIIWSPVDSPHKGPITRKMFPFDDVIPIQRILFIHIVIQFWLVIVWWRHQMETFSALLALCAGNSPVPGDFPAQRPVTRSCDVFFDLRLNNRLSKQWRGWWFETLSRPFWRHSNEIFYLLYESYCLLELIARWLAPPVNI